MSNSKRHHTTPCLILRNFSDSDEKFFVFDKRRQHDGVIRDSIYNRFVRKHQNSLKKQDGTRDCSLEDHFTSIETAAAPVIRKIIRNVRQRKNLNLNSEEKNIWDHFLLTQWRRTPDFREKICPLSEFHVTIHEILDEYEQQTGKIVTSKIRQEMTTPDKVAAFRERGMFDSLKNERIGARDVLAQRGIGVAVIYEKRKSFILGENTVNKLTPDHTTNLADPDVEAWFTIASDIAVTPWGKASEEKVVTVNDRQIRRFNEVTFGASKLLASRSKALLESLARINLHAAA